MTHQQRVSVSARPFLVAILYGAASCLWIFLSDELLLRFSPLSPVSVTLWSILKGFLFVGVSSALFYTILRKLNRTNRTLESIVTERTSALAESEQQLRKSEEQFRTLANTIPQLCWMANPDGWIYWYNQRWYEYTGTVPSQMEGWGWQSVHDPETLPQVLEQWRSSITTGKPFDMVFPLRGADGVFRSFLTRVESVKDVQGKVAHWFGTNTDISKRKNAEEELRQASEHRRLALEAAELGAWDYHFDTGQVLWDERCRNMFGFPTAEQIDYDVAISRIHSDDRLVVDEAVRQAIAGVDGGAYHREYRVIWPDGSIHWVASHGRVFFDVEGDNRRAIRFIGVNSEITKRKEVEQALHESEERFRLVVEGAPDGIYVQADGLIRYLNRAAVALFGAQAPDQIVGQSFMERLHPDDRVAVIERVRVLREERRAVPLLEERYLRLDGTPFEVEVTGIPVTYGSSEGAIVFFRDITERKRILGERLLMEQQLLQAQKMEAIGRLAGGIAHDFNNLLMVIRSYTEMLQDSLPSHDRLRRNTQQVLKAADRAASLTGQLLAFSRKQVISPVVLDLNSVVDDTSKMLKRLIGEDVELATSLTQPLWNIRSDPDQVAQVLMNLCVNARDAMPQGGTLTIATRNLRVVGSDPSVPQYFVFGDYVLLSVTDTGTGVSKDMQEKIFEPFFTTKGSLKGTGLGLSTVYGIVKQSNGYVLVDSELGQGACFTIYLPRVIDAVGLATIAKVEQAARGTETILVAEDEEALRESICEFLRSLGYTVLAASAGPAALAIASECKRIDVLLTDVVMPKMSGRELSQMLGSLQPGLKTIYMSGYTDDETLRHGVSNEGVAFLQKPFSFTTLASKVRDVLQPA